MEMKKRESLFRTIPYQLKRADRFTSRLKGLMFKKIPLQNEGLWLIPCNSIHMFFMKFPIDVVFLDREQKVIKIVQHLKPWKLIPPVKEAYSVIELPSGAIELLGIRENQIIDNLH